MQQDVWRRYELVSMVLQPACKVFEGAKAEL